MENNHTSSKVDDKIKHEDRVWVGGGVDNSGHADQPQPKIQVQRVKVIEVKVNLEVNWETNTVSEHVLEWGHHHED